MGLVKSTKDPNNQSVTYWYDGFGGLLRTADRTAYWIIGAQDALGRVTKTTAGNGVVTTKSFDATTRWAT